MNRAYKRWLKAGAMMGLAAGVAARWLSQKQVQRWALACQVSDMTQQAIETLGVPARSRFILANDVLLHTVVAGPTGAPLAILLHGFPECWYTWRKQIAPLAQAGYHVVVPDQRGYNLSDKPAGLQSYRMDRLVADVQELIRAFGRERAVIIGHDWGGVVAWSFAMRYPAATDRLIVMNAPHPTVFMRALKTNPVQRAKSWYMTFFQIPWLPETLLGLSPLSTARLFFQRTAVRTGAFSEADLQVMAAALAQPGALKAMLQWYRAAFQLAGGHKPCPVGAPTLLIWAEDDVALDKSLTVGLTPWAPDLRVHYIPRCGHWVQNEAPKQVNARMLEFLQESA